MELTAKFYLQAVNRGDCTHLMTKGREAYLTKLNAVCDAGPTLAPNSFRFENGILIADAVGQMASIYSGLAYVVIYSKQYDFWECYYIVDAKFSQNKVYFGLQKDLWGTYVPEAEFSDIHATRTNRNVGNGIYPNIEITKTEPQFVYTNGGIKDATEMCAVALFNLSMEEGKDSTLSASYLAFIPLDGLPVAMEAKKAKLPLLMVESDFLGGVTAWSPDGGGNTRQAQVLKAWIVPKEWVAYPKLYQMSFYVHSKHVLPVLEDKAIYIVLKPNIYTRTFVVKTELGEFYSTLYPKSNLSAGPRGHLVPLVRNSEPSFNIVCETSSTGLSIKLTQGTNEVDITDAFALPIGTRSTQLDSLQQLVKWASFANNATLGAVKGYVKGYDKKGRAGGIAGGIAGVDNAIWDLIGTSQAPVGPLGTGDAFVTYSGVSELEEYKSVSSPICIGLEISEYDEAENIYYEGAKVDYWATSFEDIAKKPLYQGTGSETYFQGDCVVDYVPQASADYIRAELQRGIYYE